MLTADRLKDDKRLPRVPEPGVMVIFGASGDLTRRKLIPALYDLAAQRRLPMEFAVVGVSRTEMSHDDFREKLHVVLEEHLLPARRLEEARDLQRAQGLLEPARRRARYGGEPHLLPLVVPLALPDDSRAPGRSRDEPGGGRRLRQARRREALRARPRERQGAKQGTQALLRRTPDLPHRPLPRQGHSPEYTRPAVLQRHLRAHLEPALRGSRPDHRRRGHRRRYPRRFLRGGGGPARHRAEPRDAGPLSDGYGAAGNLRRRVGTRGEGEGPEGGQAHPGGRVRGLRRARPVREGVDLWGGGQGLPRGGE